MPIDDKEKRNTIAHRIRIARQQSKLKQADVAKTLGITPQAVSNYERGINAVPYDVLFRLSELYDVSIMFLLGEADALSSAAEGREDLNDLLALESLRGTMNWFLDHMKNSNSRVFASYARDCISEAIHCFADICDMQKILDIVDINTTIDSLPAEYLRNASARIHKLSDLYLDFVTRMGVTLYSEVSDDATNTMDETPSDSQ